ncbi:MAG: hypothetical protein SGILL_007659 [Bacillariaceae sp.]
MDLASLKKRLLASSEKEITLNHDEYKTLAAAAAPEVHPISVTLRLQRSTFRISDVNPAAMTVAFLVDEAITKWKSLTDTSFSIYSDRDYKHSVSDAFLQVCTYPRTLYVKTEQTGFSDFTEDDALKYAGVQDIDMDDEENSVFPAPITIHDDNDLLAHAVKDLELKHALYNPIEKGCEYTRREFISAVLVLAASIAGVKLACEEQVDGSAGKGPVDWMAHYQNHRICITEGKKDNISGGLYQNLAQLAAASEGRGTKRSFCVDLPLFGIATTYTEWIFLRLEPIGPAGAVRSAVRLPTDYINVKSNLKGDTKAVAERIAALLLHQKGLVDTQTGGEGAKKSKAGA